ncbi:hypothetical protein ACLUWU_07340 [Bifidobacterium thermophilum]|uniref:hypothetical protein n=1 Tax=Bifidobacterium thermophilum TaxID=33905 RepID=UPI0039920874
MNGIERKARAQADLNRQLAHTRDPGQAVAIIQAHPSMRLHIDQGEYTSLPEPTDLIHAWKKQPWQDRGITVTCAARHADGDVTPITPGQAYHHGRPAYDQYTFTIHAPNATLIYRYDSDELDTRTE